VRKCRGVFLFREEKRFHTEITEITEIKHEKKLFWFPNSVLSVISV